MGTITLYVTTIVNGQVSGTSTLTTITVGNDDGVITAEEWAAFTTGTAKFNAGGTAALFDQTGSGNSQNNGLLYTPAPVTNANLASILNTLVSGDFPPVSEDALAFCFMRGTLIRTPNGDIPVENLREGDLVLTMDNGPQELRWIGCSTTSAQELRPIRIRANALGNGYPSQDLYVSPDHRVVVRGWRAEVMFGEEEVLVAARNLVNDDTIVQVADDAPVQYFHLLFDRHEIVFSNGTPTESFHPAHASLDKASASVRQEIFALFPSLRTNVAAFGKAARTVVSAREARMIMS